MSDPLPVSIRIAASLYAGLLRIVSRGLADRHGGAMRRTFVRIARESHEKEGAFGVARVLLASTADTLRHAALSHRTPRPTRRRHRPHARGAPGRSGPVAGPRAAPLAELVNDIRIAARSLGRRPALLIVTTLTLALGIGATAAVFSVAWGAWLKPLPYPEAHRLVRLSDRHESFGPDAHSTVSVGDYVDLKEGNRTLESTTIFTYAEADLEGTARRLTLLYAEPTLFRTLGIPPVLGRDFAMDGGGEEATVVISHELWTQEFGGSTEALGRSVTLFGRSWTVIGVAPADLELAREVDGVVPFRWTEEQRNAHGGRSMHAMGRLRPGVSAAAAQEDLRAIYAGVAARYPETHQGWTVRVSPFRDYVVGSDHTVLWLLGAAASLLFLVSCVNVAGLLLARAERRRREVAVRSALGAGRGRIAAAFLAESLVMACLGGLAGVAVAAGGIELLTSIFGDGLRRPSEIGLNGATLSVVLGLVFATSLGVGMVPALRLDLGRLSERLKDGVRASGRRSLPLRRSLVVTQIALAVVLVCGAGLLLNTMWRIGRADLGFEPRGALVAYLELPEARYRDSAEQDELVRRLSRMLEDHEAVVAVGAGDRVPPDGTITDNGIIAAGRPETSTDFVVLREVTPAYFAAAGIEFVAGGPFEWLPPSDADSGSERALPVVINRTLARALFSGEDPLGRLIESRGGRQRVVGVVESVHQRGATEAARPVIYFPWPAVPLMWADRPAILVRGAGPTPEAESAASSALRDALAEIDPEIRFTAQPLAERLGRLYGEQEFALSLMGIFAVLALVLGAVGVYGIVSFTVAQRTREVGVRIALGAPTSEVMGMVLRQGLWLVAVGVGLGLGLSAGLGRFLAGLLYQVPPVDAVTYLAVTGIFLGTAVVACLVPARRAAGIEPTEALRTE